MVTLWATFLLKQISCFKAWFVVGISMFQKWFDVDILDFQIELCCRYFGMETVRATF